MARKIRQFQVSFVASTDAEDEDDTVTIKNFLRELDLNWISIKKIKVKRTK